MRGYTITPAAQADLAIETIAAFPKRGHTCSEIRAGYYKFPAGSHRLFYRISGTTVEIVRILHQRMDFERHI